MKLRLSTWILIWPVILVIATSHCAAADVWGGSVGITNDYLVRGMSRTDNQAALQLDAHYANSNGLIAGAFASNTRNEVDHVGEVELDAFVGFASTLSGDWHGKILANRYFYVGHGSQTGYDYNEFQLDVAYRDWLDLALIYSPDAPRYVTYLGLFAAKSYSAEVNLQRSLWKRLSATAGVGYSYFDGPDAEGYAYWSVGCAYDLAPLSLSVAYVDTTPGAKALFYNETARGRVTAAVIWRF